MTPTLSSTAGPARRERVNRMVAKSKKRSKAPERVLIRSYGSGVHFGTLVAKEGTEVTLRDARRVWYWTGANTLHELSLRGAKSGSKISEPVPSITVTGVLEILPLQKEAETALAALGWDIK